MRATPVISGHEQFATARSLNLICATFRVHFDALYTCVHFIIFVCVLALNSFVESGLCLLKLQCEVSSCCHSVFFQVD